jgi:hypothetical protein
MLGFVRIKYPGPDVVTSPTVPITVSDIGISAVTENFHRVSYSTSQLEQGMSITHQTVLKVSKYIPTVNRTAYHEVNGLRKSKKPYKNYLWAKFIIFLI